MAKSRFSTKEIIAAVQEINAEVTLKEVARKYGVSTATVYRWRAKTTVSKVLEMNRLRSLEMENRQLKSRFAELELDYHSLRAALIKDAGGES